MKGMTKDERALVKWLREKLRNAERRERGQARLRNYDDATRSVGRAEAYAWTIIHIQAEAEQRSKRSGKARV